MIRVLVKTVKGWWIMSRKDKDKKTPQGQKIGFQQVSKKEEVVKKRDRGKVMISPYAWSKLLWFRFRGNTEVSGFGITSIDDPLYVTDFITVPQECTNITTEMDDEGVADYFEDMFEKGLQPCEYGRIWIHTHPGMGVVPSEQDEECLKKVFGKCEWAMMMILGGGSKEYTTSCRLRFNVGPGADVILPVEVDWTGEFPCARHDEWEQEYVKNVKMVCMYSVGTELAAAGSTYGATYDGMYGDNDVCGSGMMEDMIPEVFQMALSGDVASIKAITHFTVAEIDMLKGLGFDPGQMVWYGNEILMMDGPEDLDNWEEQQRISCGSDALGLWADDEYDEDNYTVW